MVSLPSGVREKRNPKTYDREIPDLVSTSLENVLVSMYKEEMITYMECNPSEFEEAVKLAILDKPLFSWRAAWLLWSCMSDNDKRIRPYLKDIINCITSREENHQRELLKILYKMELNEEDEAYMFNICTDIWKDINRKPSERIWALKFLLKIADRNPDLLREINFLIQKQYFYNLSPGAIVSVKKIIKGLKGL